jgi:phosphate transport system protein
MRNRFDAQMERLNNELIEMGVLIENAIAGAVRAILTQDMELADKTILIEEEINQKERDIERLCLKLLLQQQPVAKDLRLISAALKMITDMERIGDQAADICEIQKTMKQQPMSVHEKLHRMAELTIHMVNASIDAFVKKDLNLAYRVAREDDAVDMLFEQIRNELISAIRQNVDGSEQAVDILMIAKYLERIGDHANNISDWVAFSITGVHQK